jgi:hypothetical protein
VRGASVQGMSSKDVVGQERELLFSLGLWAAASAVAGVLLVRAGRSRGRPALTGIGRQAVVWGLVDSGVVLWAARHRGRPAEDDAAARRRAARMLAVTGANAVADVGYLAAAVRVARDPRFRWDGIGMMPQAAFLLLLDARHAAGFFNHVWPRAQRGR